MPSQMLARVHPYRTLLTTFAAWKLFLFTIVLGCNFVGDTYDTSAGLVVRTGHHAGVDGSADSWPGLVARLSSWDAIYFLSIARRGYRFEQEWAFGGGLPIVVRTLVKGLAYLGIAGFSTVQEEEGAVLEALTGIVVANAAHLLSALVLYRLGQLVWRDRALSLVAAILHILSPAGLFLSAPYAESSFALLSFSGYLFLALSCRAERSPTSRDIYTILAGILFGLATTFRSNGILNGIPFAWEVLCQLPRLHQRPSDTLRRLLALGIGGVCVAAGSIVPQALAYLRFCSDTSGAEPRSWCRGYLPSIYTFVQKHYWHSGFLRYWTVSNLPLFLLAAPMLAVLVRSGVEQLRTDRRLSLTDKPAESARLLSLVRSAAAAQVLLAVLAVTMYHVQIITRISSGYPLWYWWLAGSLIRQDKSGSRIVTFMVMYASIQGVLFASFLPPA
ncbi:ER membrane glycoprotein subunit of the GPI transamidase complex-like protein [Madurella fahalii]|uniref:GPI mannosyltransferase 2 n=1 Tax=Madurella fahalii TaxID=1157608 RepID=A0ABQ0GDL9_9PEZI